MPKFASSALFKLGLGEDLASHAALALDLFEVLASLKSFPVLVRGGVTEIRLKCGRVSGAYTSAGFRLVGVLPGHILLGFVAEDV